MLKFLPAVVVHLQEEITMAEEAEAAVSVVKEVVVSAANALHQIEDHQVANEEQKVNLDVAEKTIAQQEMNADRFVEIVHEDPTKISC